MKFHRRTWQSIENLNAVLGGFESYRKGKTFEEKSTDSSLIESKETASTVPPTEDQIQEPIIDLVSDSAQISNDELSETSEDDIEEAETVEYVSDHFDYKSDNDSLGYNDSIILPSLGLINSMSNDLQDNPFSRMYLSERSTEEELKLEQVMVDMKLFICNLCKEDVKSYPGLKAHLQERHPQEKYKVCCDIVAPSFCIRLYDHIKWHLNPDLYNCKRCKLQWDNKISQIQHKIVHHKQDVLCDFCDAQFSTSTGLEEHQDKKHPIKLKCKYCGKSKYR